MSYSIRQLARLAGVSVRALHFYDEIGLLKPDSLRANGYRQYGEKELLRLQQILFLRELDFSLEEIKEILDKPGFDARQALREHRILLKKRIQRLNSLVKTVDKTLLNLEGVLPMKDNEYYDGFSREQQEKYKEEIGRKYGHKALDESEKRTGKWTQADFARIQEESKAIFQAITDHMSEGYDSPTVQEQINALFKWVNNFYTCNEEMFRGLGKMYNQHPDFIQMYKTKYHPDLPEFLEKAITYYCDQSVR
jgi:DNA-binding transcriptional MerR regulator